MVSLRLLSSRERERESELGASLSLGSSVEFEVAAALG